jgi:hypothetical protein
MNNTDMPGRDLGGPTHHPGTFGGKGCQALCAANAKCKAWTWVIRGTPAGSGDCCQKTGPVCPKASPGMVSGAKIATTIPKSQCGGGSGPTPSTTTCAVAYVPGAKNVTVTCGKLTDTVPLV